MRAAPAKRRKPTQSAEAVAALRAASCGEPEPSVRNPDYLARDFVTSAFYRSLLALPSSLSKRLIERLSPGSYSYFLARTHFIDTHLRHALHDGFEQVVILGAGYDSRAMRFAKERGTIPVFEIDLESTQQAKRERMLMRGVSQPAHTHYLAHDFTQGDLITTLTQAGFRLSKKTLFIWEGVSYYLPEDAVLAVFRELIGAAVSGSRMVFDYSLKSFVNGATDTYGGVSMQRWLKKNNEPFLFGSEVAELPHVVSPFGLRVVEDLSPADYSQRYLISPEGAAVGQPLGHLRMALVEKLPFE